MSSLGAHSKYSPSAAHRWMRCTGSMGLIEKLDLPYEESVYAQEGTNAHELAEEMIGVLNPERFDAAAWYPTRSSLSFVVEQDMLDHVIKYVEPIQLRMKDPMVVGFIEHRVNFAKSLGEHPDKAFGTVDALIVDTANNILEVHDLKYGRGVRVDAEENEQLLLYTLGAYEEFSSVYDIKRIKMVIHQPRLSHYSEWEITPEQLLEFKDKVVDAVLQTKLPDGGGLTPGEKQCRFCDAKAHCPALKEKIDREVIDSFDDLERNIHLQDTVDLAAALSKVDMVESWCKAIRKRALAELTAGGEIPGYKLVRGRAGPRRWSDEEEAARKLKYIKVPKKDSHITKLKSPTQLEKILLKKDYEKLEECVTRSEGALSIATIDDKRPAYSPVASASEFETEN